MVGVTLPPLRERGRGYPCVWPNISCGNWPLPGQPAKSALSPAASQALLAHGWPGNVRELRNVMHNATVTVRGPAIDGRDLPLAAATAAGSPDTLDSLLALPWNEAIARLEKALLTRALRAAGGNRTEAARRLEMHRQLLYAKLKEHGLGDEPAASTG